MSQGLGCSPTKAVRERGLERRETVRSLSSAGVGDLRGAVPSTRGPGRTQLSCASCSAKSTAGWRPAEGISADSTNGRTPPRDEISHRVNRVRPLVDDQVDRPEVYA